MNRAAPHGASGSRQEAAPVARVRAASVRSARTNGGPSRRTTVPGIALVMTMTVIILLTAFISEFFFTTGLEMRSVQTFKDASSARNLAKLVFKAVQIGMLNDEQIIMQNYRRLQETLQLTALPWKDGLLVRLDIYPQDGLFNLNELSNVRDDTDQDVVRWNLFRNLLSPLNVTPPDPEAEPFPVPEEQLADMFAALVDWMDENDVDYVGASYGSGAESGVYSFAEPEIEIKNGAMDRLSELRLVRGFANSGLAWERFAERFAVLPKSKKSEPYPERLNVNVATGGEIRSFLERRANLGEDLKGPTWKAVQDAVDLFNDNAEDLIRLLAPADEVRLPMTARSLESAISSIGLLKSKARYTKQIFTTVGRYYRVLITTSVNEIDANLEAVIEVDRDETTRIGSAVSVLHLRVD